MVVIELTALKTYSCSKVSSVQRKVCTRAIRTVSQTIGLQLSRLNTALVTLVYPRGTVRVLTIVPRLSGPYLFTVAVQHLSTWPFAQVSTWRRFFNGPRPVGQWGTLNNKGAFGGARGHVK